MTKLLSILIAVLLVSGVALAADQPDKMKELSIQYQVYNEHSEMLKNRIRGDQYELREVEAQIEKIKQEAATLKKEQDTKDGKKK